MIHYIHRLVCTSELTRAHIVTCTDNCEVYMAHSDTFITKVNLISEITKAKYL